MARPRARRWGEEASGSKQGSAALGRDVATISPLALPAGRGPVEAGGPIEAGGPVTYTVVSGDSVWAIAQSHGSSVAAIAAQNGLSNPGLIFPGQLLVIPGTESAAETPAAPVPEPPPEPGPEPAAEPPAPPQGTYTVRPGDSLSAIAGAVLGDAGRWPELYDLNRDVIGGNPGMISVGTVLRLPGGAAPPAPEAPAPEAPQADIPGAGAALAWQAGQLAAGNSYAYWCLAFVNQAYQAAGRWIAELQTPSAADTMDRYIAQGRLQAWDAASPPPRGALIFWGRTASSQFGHVAVSNGDGTVSTSGWTGFGGSQAISLERLNAMLGRSPQGWSIP